MTQTHTLPPLYYYIARLVRTYPFTKRVMCYITGWAEELRRKYNDPFLVQIAREAYADEKGHDTLILKDLQELKIPVQLALDQFPSDSVQQCIASFKESVAKEPLHFLAWLFYVEDQAVKTVTKQVLQDYHNMLGPFCKASRFWKVHSVMGPEVDHVEKRLSWIQALPAGQKETVLHELQKVTRILSSQTFDLNEEAFEIFINDNAPHLFEVAYKDRIHAMDLLPQ